MRRVSLLQWSIVLWSLAMTFAGAATSFGMLLISRLVLGGAIATTGPTLASLTGDFFPSRERGKIYGFILTSGFIGSVIGLFVSGNAAAISWRLAFWVLVLPSAILAWPIWRFLPEPARGGASRLEPRQIEPSSAERASKQIASPAARLPSWSAVKRAGVRPREENLLSPGAARMSLWDAVRTCSGSRPTSR